MRVYISGCGGLVSSVQADLADWLEISSGTQRSALVADRRSIVVFAYGRELKQSP